MRILSPGLAAIVVEAPGRTGLWGVGVPPSGPADPLSLARANEAVGNAPETAGIEALLQGPAVDFDADAVVAVTGASAGATLDGEPVRRGVPVTVRAGQRFEVGSCPGPGLRAYLAVRGGIDVAPVLGSRSTFAAGNLGGHRGRTLKAGDELKIGTASVSAPHDVGASLPQFASAWQLRVVPGPHGAPDLLEPEDVRTLLERTWRVSPHLDRTGIRLDGPEISFARGDGGEAGLHPSNIHDSPYTVGAIMLAGGQPIVVGPDGPSLGGFLVAAVVLAADMWKLGQLRPGDSVDLVALDLAAAATSSRGRIPAGLGRRGPLSIPPLARASSPGRPELVVRALGERHLLAEAGPAQIDLPTRVLIHIAANALRDSEPGLTEIVEGVRSVLFGVERRAELGPVAERLAGWWDQAPDPADFTLEGREVVLPLSYEDPNAQLAIDRYVRNVRADAPWCPDNIEFIRRINGLQSRRQVEDIVFGATYLVLGLGDVYLGAPLALPLDPGHRLVTTKYDPARTWTPANLVGIGGAYLGVYGIEGPGGYQLVGRTIPVWRTEGFADGPPWLLRIFDRVRFAPVSDRELEKLRAATAAGEYVPPIEPVSFCLAEVLAQQREGAAAAERFLERRNAAFAAERDAWAAASV